MAIVCLFKCLLLFSNIKKKYMCLCFIQINFYYPYYNDFMFDE